MAGREFQRRQRQSCPKAACEREVRLRADPGRTGRIIALSPKAMAAKAASPKSGPFETNISAKDWHLLAPDGTAYHFRNLTLWLSRHPDLFDPDDLVEVRRGTRARLCRAQSALGKLRPERTERRGSWKGWEWLGEEEEA